MPIADAQTHQIADLHKEELLLRLFGAAPQIAGAPAPLTDVIPPGSNVLGVGYGAKVTAGAAVDELAVRVYVRAKMPATELGEADRVPADINGTPTDVIPVGDINAFACGGSVGHVRITAGTLGCLVARNPPGGPTVFILSNNHVLANSSDLPPGVLPPGGGAPPAAVGDPILRPGPLDGGVDPRDRIAQLTDWQPIDFTAVNHMDAAIAELLDPAVETPNIRVIGRVANPPVPAALYQSVRKHGRTTLHTVGVVMDLSASIKVRYGTRLATFDRQLGIVGAGGTFSSGGDSGSLIVDAVNLNPVGLLFAGGGSLTFANPIDPVLGRFGVQIL